MSWIRSRSHVVQAGLRLTLLAVGLGAGVVAAEIAVRVARPEYRAVRTDRAMWRYDSTLGWTTRRNIEVVQEFEEQHRVSVRINSRGFRGGELPFARNPERDRLLVLGDSFAFGFGVEVEERLTEVIARDRTDVECVNLGVSGYATDQELLLYRREGVLYDPDVVVVMYVTNDPWANARPHGHGHPKPRFVIDDEGLVLSNVPVPRSGWRLRVKYALMRHSALFNLLRLRLSGPPPSVPGAVERVGGRDGAGPSQSTNDESTRITRRLIRQFQAEAEERGSRFLVLIVASGDRLDRNVPANVDLAEWCDRNGIDCVDTYPRFRRHAEEEPEVRLFLQDRQHWTARGHELAAEVLLQALVDRSWLEPVDR